MAHRREEHAAKRPHEVLVVRAKIEGKLDEIAIFKGFSISLTHRTAFNPDVPGLNPVNLLYQIWPISGYFVMTSI
ncbi:hypothetical protein PN499_01050 [Kamptonema animale CS-326]|jgi:hypothetical protein|uniref:DUF7734 family protein n=1 Tax=Kamptonema animale TaxID=92934 RepID=UPI00232CF312|nr:hypothetical protein [Kamptonema animale]MDB9509791.1 hypothetical protein [Kamptonema animale CS-326]